MEKRSKEEQLSGLNINAEPIHVNHSELTRASEESIYRSECPVCTIGFLLVKRNQETFRLESEDNCILCAQRVIYDDINDLRTVEDF